MHDDGSCEPKHGALCEKTFKCWLEAVFLFVYALMVDGRLISRLLCLELAGPLCAAIYSVRRLQRRSISSDTRDLC
jgi:hypothetical protein